MKLLAPYLRSYMKIKSKWVNDPNVRAKTISERLRVNLYDLEFDNGFSRKTLKVQTNKGLSSNFIVQKANKYHIKQSK